MSSAIINKYGMIIIIFLDLPSRNIFKKIYWHSGNFLFEKLKNVIVHENVHWVIEKYVDRNLRKLNTSLIALVSQACYKT